jgi:hypothetical protein
MIIALFENQANPARHLARFFVKFAIRIPVGLLPWRDSSIAFSLVDPAHRIGRCVSGVHKRSMGIRGNGLSPGCAQ